MQKQPISGTISDFTASRTPTAALYTSAEIYAIRRPNAASSYLKIRLDKEIQ
ncbi:TPA: hypothetical protein ACFU1W_000220 [Neisseria oralis]|uniref:Uncharacterized protein n=1 Tax=Neisseria oralis TaxID=1107316 RepID=A0ABW8Q1P9_9NEIS|nr:hypothetical protein [Neisseria sp. oral taxon 014]